MLAIKIIDENPGKLEFLFHLRSGHGRDARVTIEGPA
jgi:hypothetical protein